MVLVYLLRGDNEDLYGLWSLGVRGGGVLEWLIWRYVLVFEDVFFFFFEIMDDIVIGC